MRKSRDADPDAAKDKGAGNSIFTLMKHNENPDLTVYATDYSYQAVEVVKVSRAALSRRYPSLTYSTSDRDRPAVLGWTKRWTPLIAV